jgi:hypothetical protein
MKYSLNPKTGVQSYIRSIACPESFERKASINGLKLQNDIDKKEDWH